MADARKRLFKKQRRKRGFSDDELWSLDHTAAKFLLPRLRRFKKLSLRCMDSGPEKDERKATLDEMIEAFEVAADESRYFPLASEKDREKLERGLRAFAEFFGSLWM